MTSSAALARGTSFLVSIEGNTKTRDATEWR